MYRYLSKSPFLKKINYSYSKYIGFNQIITWREYRSSFIQKQLQASLFDSFNNRSELIKLKTFQRFNNINKNLNEGSYNFICEEIDLLLKRFEVTKKIFIDYDDNFRSKSRIYDCVSLYELFGVILIKAYKLSDKIQYLNALVKLNDILCSYYLDKKAQRTETFNLLLIHEMEFIDILIKGKCIGDYI